MAHQPACSLLSLNRATRPPLIRCCSSSPSAASACSSSTAMDEPLRRTHAAAAAAAASSRRSVIRLAAAAVVMAPQLLAPRLSDAAGGLPSGFNPLIDKGDGYKFLYPFGWQEVSVSGQDVVYKDIIEPLESVSVSLTDTDKQDITDFGPIEEVATTLAAEVLSPPGQKVKVLNADMREVAGKKYYAFEFEADAGRYVRHALAVVAVANGKFYALTTGANQRRWQKMEERLRTVAKSFQLI